MGQTLALNVFGGQWGPAMGTSEPPHLPTIVIYMPLAGAQMLGICDVVTPQH